MDSILGTTRLECSSDVDCRLSHCLEFDHLFLSISFKVSQETSIAENHFNNQKGRRRGVGEHILCPPFLVLFRRSKIVGDGWSNFHRGKQSMVCVPPLFTFEAVHQRW